MPAAMDSLEAILLLLNPTALEEMEDTLDEEKWEMDAMLALVILVMIGIVVVGLFVTWQYCCKSGTSTDLEAQQKPGDQEAQQKSGVQKM